MGVWNVAIYIAVLVCALCQTSLYVNFVSYVQPSLHLFDFCKKSFKISCLYAIFSAFFNKNLLHEAAQDLRLMCQKTACGNSQLRTKQAQKNHPREFHDYWWLFWTQHTSHYSVRQAEERKKERKKMNKSEFQLFLVYHFKIVTTHCYASICLPVIVVNALIEATVLFLGHPNIWVTLPWAHKNYATKHDTTKLITSFHSESTVHSNDIDISYS